MIRAWSTFVFLLLAMPMLAWAQTTGKISGRVTDAETGEPLPGATVVIEGTTLGASTNLDGNYTILEVPAGTHTLVASFVGYITERREGVDIIAGITSRQNYQLQETALELEVVEVTAQRPLVNPTATNAVRRLGLEEIKGLPSRDVSTFYAIQPGVTLLNDEVYIRGGRPDETEFLLEGISSRSLLGTDNVLPVIPEALEEIQVLAGGYSAELGGANAGIVQQVLRTGGQRLSSMVMYETDRVASTLGDEYGYSYDDLTLTLGGPLVWDQHRFFVAVNYRDSDNYDPMFFFAPETDLGQPEDDIQDDVMAPSPLVWKDGQLPGIGRPEELLRVNGTLLFDFSPLRFRLGFAQMNRDRRLNDLPIFNIFNQERIPKREDLRRLVNLQTTYFLGSMTFLEANLGYFQYDFERYDPLIGKPEADGQGGAVLDLVNYYSRDAVAEALAGDPEKAELYTKFWNGQYSQPTEFIFNGFEFAAPGMVDPFYQYFKREQSYYNLGLSLTSQIENHELNAGGHYQRWTVRQYDFRGRTLASRIQNDPTFIESIRAETPEVAATIRRAADGGIGYDEFMNEVDSGPDGPKHPVTASLYINDKLEFEDIIVNAGLRYDYFDMDLVEPDDLENPGFDSDNFTVEGLKKAGGKGFLQPRLGLSFPVTDRTVFHLQYGKFAQMPDMNFVYSTRAFMAVVFGGQNFIPSPFAFDLDPIESTQYEIGFGHQFTDFASFDITAFYRKTEGQLEIIRQDVSANAAAADYNLFVNGDFAIARGLEFTLRTRRVANFMGMLNYTLTDAKGTNAEPGGQVSALENGTAPPSLIQPLEFEERHRGSIVLDYRSGLTGNPATENWTGNILLTFHSGHRFTRSTGGIGQRGADEGGLLTDGDPRNRIPLEPLGSSTTPWFFQTDLRVEKGFSFGPAVATAFFYVQNLFNTQNAINVFLRTGNAENDGFLTDPELSELIVAGRGQGYVDYYRAINLLNRQHYMDPVNGEGIDLFADPRQVRIGLRLEF